MTWLTPAPSAHARGVLEGDALLAQLLTPTALALVGGRAVSAVALTVGTVAVMVWVGVYPIATFQYSSTTLSQASDHIQSLFSESDNRISL